MYLKRYFGFVSEREIDLKHFLMIFLELRLEISVMYRIFHSDLVFSYGRTDSVLNEFIKTTTKKST